MRNKASAATICGADRPSSKTCDDLSGESIVLGSFVIRRKEWGGLEREDRVFTIKINGILVV